MAGYDFVYQRFIGVDRAKREMVLRVSNVSELNVIIKNNPYISLYVMIQAINYEIGIEKNLLNAMNDNIESLDRVPYLVITDALRDMLTLNKPITRTFKSCEKIVVKLLPMLADTVGFDHNSKYHQHNVYEHCLAVADNCNTEKFTVKLAALLHDVGKPTACIKGTDGYNHYKGHPRISYDICKESLPKYLRLGKKELTEVLDLIAEHDNLIPMDKDGVQEIIDLYGKQFIYDWVILKTADLKDHINLHGVLKEYNPINIISILKDINNEKKMRKAIVRL